MVYKKYTKKIYKYRGGSNKSNNKTEEDEKVSEKEMSMFPKLDFSEAFFVDDMGLGFTPRTRKDYIKQSIVIKKKKQAEKKTLKEKMSTLTGLAPVKRMKNGLFKAIDKGMTEGAANYRDFLNKAERLKEYVTLEGKYGKQFKNKLFKAADGAKGISSDYKKTSRRLDPRFDKDGNKIVKKNKSTAKNILKDIEGNTELKSLFANLPELHSNISTYKNDVLKLCKLTKSINNGLFDYPRNETKAINKFQNFVEEFERIYNLYEKNFNNIKKMIKSYDSFATNETDTIPKEVNREDIKSHLQNKNFYKTLTDFKLLYFGLFVCYNFIIYCAGRVKKSAEETAAKAEKKAAKAVAKKTKKTEKEAAKAGA